MTDNKSDTFTYGGGNSIGMLCNTYFQASYKQQTAVSITQTNK